MPCLEGMMRNLSRRAKAESEFNALVDMVSDAVRDARKHHTRDGVKVCAHTCTYNLPSQYIQGTGLVTMHLICPLVLCNPPMLFLVFYIAFAYFHECVFTNSVNNTSSCYITHDWYVHCVTVRFLLLCDRQYFSL